MADPRDDVLDSALRDLARSMDTGPSPDVAPAVLRRLRADDPGRRPTRRQRRADDPRRRPRRRRLLPVVVAAGAAMLIGVPAAAGLLGIPGVRLDFGHHTVPTPSRTPPTTSTATLGTLYGLSGPVPLAEASRRAGFSTPLPHRADLGAPEETYVRASNGAAVVTMLWRARPGLPALAGGQVGLMVDVFRGDDQIVLKKLLQGVPIQAVSVHGRQGLWIAGPHDLLLFDAEGRPDLESARLAGRTLLFPLGSLTVRLESQLDRAQAITLGGTVG